MIYIYIYIHLSSNFTFIFCVRILKDRVDYSKPIKLFFFAIMGAPVTIKVVISILLLLVSLKNISSYQPNIIIPDYLYSCLSLIDVKIIEQYHLLYFGLGVGARPSSSQLLLLSL